MKIKHLMRHETADNPVNRQIEKKYVSIIVKVQVIYDVIVLWIRSIVKRRKMKKALKAKNPEL